MGEMKHTAEPWIVDLNNTYQGKPHYMVGVEGTTTRIALTGEIGSGDDDESIANARRIVACVNACRGISNEILEDPEYLIKKELETIDDLVNLREKAESERGEMRVRLAALEDIATAVEADIDAGRPLEYNVEELRAELIRARRSIGILPEQEMTREEEIEAER